jgi:hypothetical protein
MLQAMKSLLKPAFMKGLNALVERRWRSNRKGRPHGLPAPLIVSLTSYHKRFDVLAATLKTLLTQTVAADRVVLWIAHADLDRLPPEVRALEARGLSIQATDDLRSYKKIIPALKAFPDAFIVTADDDVYYPERWLETFSQAHVPGDPTVLAHRAHRMMFDGADLAPYDRWIFEIDDPKPGWDVFFTGVGGVFYPPGALHPDTADVDLLTRLCPTGDDIWLNWMAKRNGAQVRKIGPKRRFYEWPGSQGVALQNSNRGAGDGNDQQIRRIVEMFGIPGMKS